MPFGIIYSTRLCCLVWVWGGKNSKFGTLILTMLTWKTEALLINGYEGGNREGSDEKMRLVGLDGPICKQYRVGFVEHERLPPLFEIQISKLSFRYVLIEKSKSEPLFFLFFIFLFGRSLKTGLYAPMAKSVPYQYLFCTIASFGCKNLSK